MSYQPNRNLFQALLTSWTSQALTRDSLVTFDAWKDRHPELVGFESALELTTRIHRSAPVEANCLTRVLFTELTTEPTNGPQAGTANDPSARLARAALVDVVAPLMSSVLRRRKRGVVPTDDELSDVLVWSMDILRSMVAEGVGEWPLTVFCNRLDCRARKLRAGVVELVEVSTVTGQVDWIGSSQPSRRDP